MKVGAVVWQPLQSPVVGCTLSKACGRESPQAVALLAIIPRYGPVSWQVAQLLTAAATVVCPATVRVGLEVLATPSLKPPALTLPVVWQPEPLQSRLPNGMWLLGLVTTVTLPNVVFTVEPWQERHPVTPWWVPVTE